MGQAGLLLCMYQDRVTCGSGDVGGLTGLLSDSEQFKQGAAMMFLCSADNGCRRVI